jgi:hypothetical protein
MMTQSGILLVTYDVPTATVESQSRKKMKNQRKKRKRIFIYSAFHASLNMREGRWRTTGVIIIV